MYIRDYPNTYTCMYYMYIREYSNVVIHIYDAPIIALITRYHVLHVILLYDDVLCMLL